MFGVPLKAMCSNMWARPVIPGTSWAEPVSTKVAKEKTGATGRSTRTKVQPLSRMWTVVRFSKDARSWADAGSAANTAASRAAARHALRAVALSIVTPRTLLVDGSVLPTPYFTGYGTGSLRRGE